jgi:hypothetical protein
MMLFLSGGRSARLAIAVTALILSPYACFADLRSTNHVKVTSVFLFEQAYDAERNVIEGARETLPMANVEVSIRAVSGERRVTRGQTDSEGRFNVRLRPGRYSIGLARSYFADRFCPVPQPACLGYRVELSMSRGLRKVVRVVATQQRFRVRYQEEFGV